MKRLAPILLCLFILSGCSAASSSEEPFVENLHPYLDPIVSDVGKNSPLSDLSYAVRVDEIQSETSADGEIIFISDELDEFTPEEQYAITQEISRLIFLKLTGGGESLFNIKIGDWRLTLSHGVGYSVWQTSTGSEYKSSYYALEKDGVEIYDNPANDLEAELEATLGMPYDEWLKRQSDDIGSVVASDDKDFWMAVTAAQELVKDELKSPLTARFPVSADSYAVRRNGDNWEVAGYVDAQNGFGATIREHWVATFTMGDTGGTQYKVSDFKVSFG